MQHLTFLFDPRSPWCYQTSRWVRRLGELGEVSVDWGVLSLEVVNLGPDEDPAEYDAEYGPALRVAVRLRETHGPASLGWFYEALGELMWLPHVEDVAARRPQPAPDMADLTADALERIGVGRGYAAETLADRQSWPAVLAEHQRWTQEAGAFGVPTLVVDQGSDPPVVVFGPVIRELPDDEICLELWRHVWGLARIPAVYEVKKRKALTLRADLPAAVWRANLRIADMRAARALMAPGGTCEGASLEWTMGVVRAGRE